MKTFLLIILTLTLARLASSSAAADNEFRLFTQPLEIPERGQVTSYVLLAGTKKFRFLPPPGWQVKAKPEEQRIQLMPRDRGASVTITFTNAPLAGPDTNALPKFFRERIEQKFPGAKIAEEFPCYTSGFAGAGFDLEYTSQARAKLISRIGFVMADQELIEFDLTAPAKSFESYTLIFGNLLTSFQIVPSMAE